MKLSILTTVTNPEKREDKWVEALSCYLDLADEVVVVDGGESPIGVKNNKLKIVPLSWDYEWNWIELPKHLNAGLKECTGDWILKLDIDQFIHENDFKRLRDELEKAPSNMDVATFQKMTMLYGGKYYQKGEQEIAFRNKEYIKFGKNISLLTDLCFPVKVSKYEDYQGYQLPVGCSLNRHKTGISYWNYDYFFKTQEFTRKEFWRFSKAHNEYFGLWMFGSSEEKAFNKFLSAMKNRHDNAPYTAELKDHSKYIREEVEILTADQFGHSAWGLI